MRDGYFRVALEYDIGEDGLVFEGSQLLLGVEGDFSDGEVLVGEQFLLAGSCCHTDG